MAAASTLVAEFSSQVVRAVASGFGNTFSLVYLMISDLPSAVDAGDCGGAGLSMVIVAPQGRRSG